MSLPDSNPSSRRIRRRLGRLLALAAMRLYYLPALILMLADTVAGTDTLELWLDEQPAEKAVA